MVLLIINSFALFLIFFVCLYPGHISAQTLEEEVVYFSQKQGVDPNLALSVALCESGVWDKELKKKVIDPTAKNPESSASSVFQFLKSTWNDTTKRMGWLEGTNVFDPHLNIIAGIWLLKTDGTIHWKESESCWKNS